METTKVQIWQGSKFNVERIVGETAGEVTFRFIGPFTARDMYSSISPAVLRDLLHAAAGPEPVTTHILDFTCVPYIDSSGLGMVVDYFTKCQKAGVRVTVVGAGARVMEQFRLTKIDTLFPISA